MYEQFYNLTKPPFANVPDPGFIYLSPQHKRALSILMYAMMTRAGFCVVTGDVGSGKTMLVRKLLQDMDRNVEVGLVSNTHCESFEEFLRWVMLAFDLEYRNKSKVEMYDELVRFMIEKNNSGHPVTLIVDEAQHLTPDFLEELRMLSNVNTEKGQILQTILIGQPELWTLLRRPELSQFAQRISYDYFLSPLDSSELVEDYICHRLRVAGREEALFLPETYDLIFNATGGVPRLINLVCDTALVYGYAEDATTIGADIVTKVLADKESGFFPVAARRNLLIEKPGAGISDATDQLSGSTRVQTQTPLSTIERAAARLRIADDGDLKLSAADDHELESAEGAHRPHERLESDCQEEIHQAHNDLKLDTDFVDSTWTGDSVDIRALPPSGVSAADTPQPEVKQGIPLLHQTRFQPAGDTKTFAKNLLQRTSAHRRRLPRPLAAVLIVLTGIGIALLYPSERVPESFTPADMTPAPQTEQAPTTSTVVERSEPDVEALPAVDQTPQLSTPRRVAGSSTATKPNGSSGAMQRTVERFTAPAPVAAQVAEPSEQLQVLGSVAAPTIAQVEATPEERPSTPQVPQTTITIETAEDLKQIRSPQAAVVADLKELDVTTTQTPAEDLNRDLIAADLALARGHLTTPPEANAYTLYNRVLAMNPESPEAKKGLQAVRHGLINRALAQLASNAFDDARGSLQAAADTGAHPQLVADLRGEVDYRQGRINAQAGQFETLLPVDQLVAVKKEPPRLPRNVPRGTDLAVEVQFTVSASGEVREVAVLGDPPKNLEEALRSAVLQWRFEPVLYNGAPVPVRSSVRFTFPN